MVQGYLVEGLKATTETSLETRSEVRGYIVSFSFFLTSDSLSHTAHFLPTHVALDALCLAIHC